jgi:RNA polymerase primary sigma factor
MSKVQKKAAMTAAADENILGMYLKDINRIPLLTREQEDATARLVVQGDKAALDKLVRSNLRFVVNVAKKYQGQGIPLQDLISEGNIGLINAAERFDPEKGFHFIIYAVWWIRQAILKAIYEKSRMIRLPMNRAGELVRIERERKNNRGANTAIGEIKDIANSLGMKSAHVEHLLNVSREMVSLDMPVFQDSDASVLVDFIEDTNYEAPDDVAMKTALRNDIESVLLTLDDKEAEVIRQRYGLRDGSPMSLWEIGDEFDLTKERIRQIEKKALKRLQHAKRKNVLESYVA